MSGQPLQSFAAADVAASIAAGAVTLVVSESGIRRPHIIPIEFGKASIVRAGTDVTVVALAKMVPVTLSLRDLLRNENTSVELIDPRTISPLDTATILQSVAKTGRLLIVEETPAAFGQGAEVAAQIADASFNDLDAPIRRVNGAFAPTPYAPSLEAAVVPMDKDIANAIRELARE